MSPRAPWAPGAARPGRGGAPPAGLDLWVSHFTSVAAASRLGRALPFGGQAEAEQPEGIKQEFKRHQETRKKKVGFGKDILKGIK